MPAISGPSITSMRPRGVEPRLLRVLDDVVADALDQRMAQPLVRPARRATPCRGRAGADAPCRRASRSAISSIRSVASGRRLRTRSSARSRSSGSMSSYTGSAPALTMPMSMPAAIAWYRKTAWIASRTASLPRNEKRDVQTPPLTSDAGQLALDPPRRLDVGDAVAGVLLDARADGEDVRVEDDVVGSKPACSVSSAMRALARSRPCARPCRPGPARRRP